ncbi:MAG: TonB-dependent receptor [Bryobacteraceae bacterium]|nr:TonB-dependent receptor [Bryobacteraceae bacterium]
MKNSLVLSFLLVAFSLATLSAQSTATGTIEGVVLDATGAVVPNANVKLNSAARGGQREVKTADTGNYRFDQVTSGIYTVTIEAAGFARVELKNVEVSVNRVSSYTTKLEARSQAETVTVNAESAPLLDVVKTDVSLSVSPKEVQALPTNGRDFANLAILAPGAKLVNSYDPTKNRVAVIGINGSAGRNINYTINGIDNKDNTVGGPVMQLPLEAVEEFNISTQRFSAANGRSEGAAVNVVTKSGSNLMHGSLFGFFRDTSLTANDYFSKQSKSPTPAISRQLYGGSFGGPIKKDRTFAFFALERQREETSIGVTDSAFRELSLVTSLGAQPARTIGTPYRDQRYTGRLDHRFNADHNFFVTYTNQANRGLNDQSGNNNDLTAGNFTTNQLIIANATLQSVLSSRAVNSFTAGYQYWNNLIDSDSKVPNLAFPGSIYFGTNTNVPQQSYQAKWQFRDDFSLTMGKHTFKAGFDFVKAPKLGGFFQTPSTLNLTFFDLPSVITSDRVKYPQGFATPGAISAMSGSSGNPYFNDRNAKMFGFYVQDDFKVSRRFSLNLGVRWDADYNLQGGNVQSQSRTYQALKAVNSPFAAGLPKNDLNNFSPRIGFALDLTGGGNHILRGGYGIYFGQTFQNIPLFMLQQANDTVFTQTLSITSTGAADPTGIVPGVNKPLGQFRYGVDPLPSLGAGSTRLTAGAVGRLVDPNFVNPYNHQFNLGYAWQLNPGSVLEVEGIFVQGLREAKRQNINYIRPELGNSRPYDAAFDAAGLPRLNQIIVESSIGRSSYRAMNVSYRRRLAKRFSVNTNYVLSKTLAFAGGPAAFGNVATDARTLFPSFDFGPAPNDERNRWTGSTIVTLPFGIQLAPIVVLASAKPYSITQGSQWLGQGAGNGTNRVVVPVSDPTNYLANKTTSAANLRAGVANGTLKMLDYNTVRGQSFFQLDMRVSKIFTIADRHRIEFLSQFFNMTNRANFGNSYVGNVQSGAFGTPNGWYAGASNVVPKSFAAELGVRYSF